MWKLRSWGFRIDMREKEKSKGKTQTNNNKTDKKPTMPRRRKADLSQSPSGHQKPVRRIAHVGLTTALKQGLGIP